MKNIIFKITLAMVFSLPASSPALAWGQTGHRVTGAIAERYLSVQARAAMTALLGPETLAEASTWADFMRSSPEPFWQHEAGPFHYVTVPPGKTYAEVGAPPEGDAIVALQRFARTLRDPAASRDDKALALRFTIHIIGDLHQPLHVGNGTDRGGNDFEVLFFNQPANLHSVWDSGMIEREGLSYSEMAQWLAAKITPRQATEWASSDPLAWVAESVVIRDAIYPGEQTIAWGYSFTHMDTARTRLSQAGVRIAAYLNRLYGE
ncbi:MAG: S1/P1 nuclease [Pseudomonadota bacterium]